MANTEWTSIKVASKEMPLFVAHPLANPTRAVIVLQEIFGINSHIQEVTERVASLGYLGVSPDLFYREGQHFTCSYSESDRGVARLKAATNDDYLRDIDQVLVYLEQIHKIESSNVAVMGFCFGGRLTYMTATQREIAAGVSFYGSGIAAGPVKKTADITCPMLLFFGGLDQHIPPSDIEKVRLALHENKKEAEVITYEKADHGFFCRERRSFDPISAADAWKRTVEFFNDTLTP